MMDVVLGISRLSKLWILGIFEGLSRYLVIVDTVLYIHRTTLNLKLPLHGSQPI